MNSSSSKGVAVAVAVLALIGGPGGISRADDVADLAKLAQAEGDAYVQLRNLLIENHTGSWDIAVAAAESWELALAAYILEERTKEVDAFNTLDIAIPSNYRSVDGYGRLSSSRDANMAFLLEKLWKAPKGKGDAWSRITPERDRQFAYNTLTYSGRVAPGVGTTALWKSMWEGAEEERFRYLAIGPLCADPDPSVEPIIREILQGEGQTIAAKSRCLGGLGSNASERAKDLVLQLWDQLNSEALTIRVSSRGVLATSNDPAARELLYSLALDPAESPTTRQGIISTLGHHQRRSDRAFLQKFFAEVGSDRLKADVLSDIHRWFPLEMYREPVRQILMKSSDPKLLLPAVGALVGGYKAPLPLLNKETGEWNDWGGFGSPAYRKFRQENPRPTPRIEQLDISQWSSDLALLENLAARESLREDLHGQVQRSITGMRELRRRFEAQPTSD